MRKLLVMLFVATTAFAGAARGQFCPGAAPYVFTDVLAGDTFCGYITRMAVEGITTGCQIIDANNRRYCPDDFVTRKQMSAFMIRLADAQFPLSCAAGQVMKWNGLDWACSDDNIGGSGGGGTVTSVAAGTGLAATPNPITGAGVINLAASYQLPQSCTNGQVPKSNGSGGWACAADNDTNSGGTVTSVIAGAGLSGGNITSAGTIAIAAGGVTAAMLAQSGCANGQVLKWNGSAWACAADNAGPANAFVQGGNAFVATAVLGTTDDNALDIRVNNSRVMRYEPNTVSPNVIGGSPANNVTAGVRGATIAGGGVPAGETDPNFTGEVPNRVTDHYGTVGGGWGNRAGDVAGTTIDSAFATVGGGRSNSASGLNGTVAGGGYNTASGDYSTVGGGSNNNASGSGSMVGGGQTNAASGERSTVSGGLLNVASGLLGTVGGGYDNTASGNYSFAAGSFARADQEGCFNFSNWSAFATGSCLGSGHVARFTLDHGLSVDYFTRRPDGGGTRWVYFGDINAGQTVATWTGAFLSNSGVWTNASDRAAKDGFAPIDPLAVLDGVVQLPITRWHYRHDGPDVEHIGPTAQDFKAAFGLGQSDKGIGTVDADGVALAAIQGLNAKLEARVAAKDAEIAALKREMADLRLAVEVLMARTSTEGRVAQTR